MKIGLAINDPETAALSEYLRFVDVDAAQQTLGLDRTSRSLFSHEDIEIKLGSIHSVKGRTVDAMLVVESEIWRGPKKEEKVMDLAAVLPHAFGIENKVFSNQVAQFSAATNIFVAATRPREVLAFAVRKAAVKAELIEAARAQGWNIIDLCKTV
jgi:DNA helicase-2/ATP-dependent DNA helicase PcrA